MEKKVYDKNGVSEAVERINKEIYEEMKDMSVIERLDFLALTKMCVTRWTNAQIIRGASKEVLEKTNQGIKGLINKFREGVI